MPKQSLLAMAVSLKRTTPPQPIFTRIADEGALLPSQFNVVNFIGPDVAAAADIPNARVNVTLAGIGATGGWTRDAGPTTTRLTTAADQVAIGTAAGAVGRKVTVTTTGANQGLRTVGLVATDNALDAGGAGEANLRLSVDVAGLFQWGPGGAGALDTRVQRSGVGALTLGAGLILGQPCFVRDVGALDAAALFVAEPRMTVNAGLGR